jgi:hypothetical protein
VFRQAYGDVPALDDDYRWLRPTIDGECSDSIPQHGLGVCDSRTFDVKTRTVDSWRAHVR